MRTLHVFSICSLLLLKNVEYPHKLPIIGMWPSGKAPGFGPGIRGEKVQWTFARPGTWLVNTTKSRRAREKIIK